MVAEEGEEMADLRGDRDNRLQNQKADDENSRWNWGGTTWLSNDDSMSLASAQRLELQIALIPLLSRRFEVIELTLVDPVIALETDSAGRGNWEIGKAPGTGAPDTGTPAATTVPACNRLAAGTAVLRLCPRPPGPGRSTGA